MTHLLQVTHLLQAQKRSTCPLNAHTERINLLDMHRKDTHIHTYTHPLPPFTQEEHTYSKHTYRRHTHSRYTHRKDTPLIPAIVPISFSAHSGTKLKSADSIDPCTVDQALGDDITALNFSTATAKGWRREDKSRR